MHTKSISATDGGKLTVCLGKHLAYIGHVGLASL